MSHAYPVGDTFTLLDRGHSLGSFARAEISRDVIVKMMAGGQEMQDLMHENDLAGLPDPQ